MAAPEVSIKDTDVVVKLRRPPAVFMSDLFSVGLYGMYWHYQLSIELAEVGRAWQKPELGENPRNSGLAMFPGLFAIVPAVVSLYRGIHRVRAIEQMVGVPEEELIHTGRGFAALMVFPPAGSAYQQSHLNRVWERAAEGAADAAPAHTRVEPAAEPLRTVAQPDS